MFSRILKAALPAANAVVSVVAPLGAFVFFTRLAEPAQVGVITYSIAWIEVLKIVTPLGLYEAMLMQEDEDSAPAAAGLLAVSALAALALYVVVILVSPHWLDKADQAAAMAIMPLSLALGGKLVFDVVLTQPLALLARRRNYHMMTVRGLVGGVGAVGFGLVATWMAGPLAGMVAYYVSQSFLYWLLMVIGVGARAWPGFNMASLKPLWPNAIISTQIRSIGTINNFFDQVMVSTFVPLAQTANYNMGRRVEMTELSASSTFISNIYQPMFARAEGEVLARNYQTALISMVALFGVPSIAVAANSASVVAVVFGAKWLTAAPLLAACAISGFSRVIQNVQGAHFSVSQKNRLLRNRSLISAAIGLAIVALTPWVGLLAVCWLITVKNVSVAAWSVGPARELASPRFMLKAVVAPAAAAAIGAFGGTWLMQTVLPHPNVVIHVATWIVSGSLAMICAGLAAAPQVKQALTWMLVERRAA